MGRGKRRQRPKTAQPVQGYLGVGQFEAERALNRKMLAGMIFGWSSERMAPVDLNPNLKTANDEALARRGLSVPRVIEDVDLTAVITWSMSTVAENLSRGRHLFATHGGEVAETQLLAKLLADIFEQGYVEIDAAEPDAVGILKSCAADPLAILILNLPDSELESRADFPQAGRKLLIDGEEVELPLLTSFFIPVSADKPPVDEILSQAEMIGLFETGDLANLEGWQKRVDATKAGALAKRALADLSLFPELAAFSEQTLTDACSATISTLMKNQASLKAVPSTEQLAELWVGFIGKYANQHYASDPSLRIDQALHWAVLGGLSYCLANRQSFKALLPGLYAAAEPVAAEIESFFASETDASAQLLAPATDRPPLTLG